MTHLTQSLSFVSQYIYAAIAWFEEFMREYRKSRNIANTINELNRLSDAELRDIGISRGDIWSIAHEASLDDLEKKSYRLRGRS